MAQSVTLIATVSEKFPDFARQFALAGTSVSRKKRFKNKFGDIFLSLGRFQELTGCFLSFLYNTKINAISVYDRKSVPPEESIHKTKY